MADLEIHYDSNGEWAALYVDRKLDTVGEHYTVEEAAMQLAGVKQVHDSPFLQGCGRVEHAANTLDEIAAYKRRMATRETRVLRLVEERSRIDKEIERLKGER